jgi:hypothetical protein
MSQILQSQKKRSQSALMGNSLPATNPKGRLPGTRAKATIAALNILEGEVDKLSRKAVELALAGDVTALRLCLERICSRAWGRGSARRLTLPVTVAPLRLHLTFH